MDLLECGKQPSFLLYNKLLIAYIHRTVAVKNAEDFGKLLNALDKSLQQPLPMIGHMIKIRGIITLTKNTEDHMTKQIKVLEYGINMNPNSFVDWMVEVSDVWNNIISVGGSDELFNDRQPYLWQPAKITLETTEQEFCSLATVIEEYFLQQTTKCEPICRSSLTQVCQEAAQSLSQNELCENLQSDYCLWEKFLSCLVKYGYVYGDGSDNHVLSVCHTRLLMSVEGAVRKLRYEQAVISNVTKRFRCNEKTVIRVLNHLEQESRIYSFLSDKGKHIYQVL
ncbi:uncharacterized protein [Watersipora subatra]|uniref:uncharacterized protein isoform X2 n=1 Tax=Watersipora subatra TaxID=2589382 RepID=UPI00355B8A08